MTTKNPDKGNAKKENSALKIGDRAPAFELLSSEGANFSLSDHPDHFLILYFYPKDDTPGCTIEAMEFQEILHLFEERNALVVGISKDTKTSHCDFKRKYAFNFPLLCDTKESVSHLYEVIRPKVLFGVTRIGVVRSTFLLAPDKSIIKIWRNVRPQGHAQKVYDTLVKYQER